MRREEIILMTKLALYEKKYGKIDKKRNAYFKWDYIYINNWYTRLATGIAAGIIIAWFIFSDVYIEEIIPVLDIGLNQYLPKYIAIFILLIILYTGISTRVFNQKYEVTQNRLRQREKILNELDQCQSLKQSSEGDLRDTFE